MKIRLLSAFCVPVLLAACTASPSATSSAGASAAEASQPMTVPRDTVTGTLAYRERMALPAAAIVQLQLQDVSRQDVAATIIDSVTIRPNGQQVPLSFALTYNPARIQESNTYAVQARILLNGQLLFMNDVSYPVITRGNPRQVQMVLRRAGK
ncbi:YbaY family lipoprotein [Hymenobacter sediminicola]|uniref:YbaY family lipoprotein n=1 Tax=Hymenobacter sediminicola TaxID=2761579 RepID=A0A7G7WAN2_9BACT|nr:YbaY family lipoprotein [Hymenobacter sediminicola]QNH63425.1 YbaY family lipoprotein [Hymenobacter sediminicola]